MELQKIFSDMPVNEAYQNCQKAMDEYECELERDQVRVTKDDEGVTESESDTVAESVVGSEKDMPLPIPERVPREELIYDEEVEKVVDHDSKDRTEILSSKFTISATSKNRCHINNDDNKDDDDEDEDSIKDGDEDEDGFCLLENECWGYAVEKLAFISTYAITLLPPDSVSSQFTSPSSSSNPGNDDNDDTSAIHIQTKRRRRYQKRKRGRIDTILRVTRDDNANDTYGANTSTWVSRLALACIILPCDIISTDENIMASLHLDRKKMGMRRNRCITFRIRYQDNDNNGHGHGDSSDITPMNMSMSTPSSVALTPSRAIDALQCRSCDAYLLRPNVTAPATTTATKQMMPGAEASSNGFSDNNESDKNRIIRSVFHLPSGHWDEITDYLTCYDGQPAIDFSLVSNVAQKGKAYEDEALLVLNKQDLSNVCVLAVDGYGEQDGSGEVGDGDGDGDSGDEQVNEDGTNNDNNTNTTTSPDSNRWSDQLAAIDGGGKDVTFRGKREWRDAVGGATICCNVCCSTLGYASFTDPDTCRLLKHRLRARERVAPVESKSTFITSMARSSPSPLVDQDHFTSNTCGSFIGKELIRFAETQAVFTFAVFGDAGHDAYGTRRCILLKVLRWNSCLAVHDDQVGNNVSTVAGAEGIRSVTPTPLAFKRIVKVVFEETDSNALSNLRSDEDITDPTMFRWGGVDLCCPPDQAFSFHSRTSQKSSSAATTQIKASSKETKIDDQMATTPQASVNIYLSSEEVVELDQILNRGRSFFSSEISDATTMGFKMTAGRKVSDPKTSLSFLTL